MSPFHRASVFNKAIVKAVKRDDDDLAVVQWIVRDYCPMGKIHVMERIAIHHTNMIWVESYCAQAAMNGQLEALQWLERTSGFKCPTYAMSTVTERGHTAVLQWLPDR